MKSLCERVFWLWRDILANRPVTQLQHIKCKWTWFYCRWNIFHSLSSALAPQFLVPEEISVWFIPKFLPVTNVSLTISVNFPQAGEAYLFSSGCFTSSKHQNGNNDKNDPANEWRCGWCILSSAGAEVGRGFNRDALPGIVIAQMHILAKAPKGVGCENLVKLFIDHGRKVFPVLRSYPCWCAF